MLFTAIDSSQKIPEDLVTVGFAFFIGIHGLLKNGGGAHMVILHYRDNLVRIVFGKSSFFLFLLVYLI